MKFLCLAYGGERTWNALPRSTQEALRAQDDLLRSRGDLVAEVRAPVTVRFENGSGALAQTLIQNDLIDEYRLLTFPVLIGTGKRLFASGTVPAAMTLVRSATARAGVVFSVCRRAGGAQDRVVRATGEVETPGQHRAWKSG